MNTVGPIRSVEQSGPGFHFGIQQIPGNRLGNKEYPEFGTAAENRKRGSRNPRRVIFLIVPRVGFLRVRKGFPVQAEKMSEQGSGRAIR